MVLFLLEMHATMQAMPATIPTIATMMTVQGGSVGKSEILSKPLHVNVI